MTYPTFDELTSAPEAIGVPLGEREPMTAVPHPLVLPDLTEAELTHDEESTDPLVPVQGERIQDLAAYWHTGMRGTVPHSLLRKSVLPRLVAAGASLPEDFGLAVFDAYRSLSLQRRLYAAAYSDPGLPPGFIAVPSENLLAPTPHLTGGAVDLTLTWRGQALALGTSFDSFTERAAMVALEEEAGPARELRRLLRSTMESQGFVAYALEWWHFEYGTPRWAAVHETRPLFGQPMAVEE